MGDDGSFKPRTMVGTLSDTTSLDFSAMDDLLYDGFWLATIDESNFWQPCPTAATDLKHSFFFPSSETSFTTNPTNHQTFLKEPEKPSILGHPPFSFTGKNENQASIPSVPLGRSTDFLFEETELNKRLWVAPTMKPIRAVSVRKKLVQAVNHLKDSIREKDVLIQIWVPVKRGGRQVLTTNNQPFSLNPNCKNLAEYRDVSRNYHFAADEDSKEPTGLPGRVFLKKLPDWTPDVQFFKREEYPRKNHAQQCDVRGSLALPVFERGSGKCLGVVEIVTTSLKVNCRPELENVCKALEAVDLKSSDILEQGPPDMEDCNESYQSVLMEIRNVLRCVCDTHKLPLAQTWSPCVQQGKGGCRHSDENYTHCVSTLDSTCYVAEQQFAGFHEACSEYHLLKGEGIAGKAFLTNQPCFSAAVTEFSKTEYPLAHHARVFNLHAAVAIRLRSTYTGTADFVLEFFLPINCKETEDQRQMLDSLSSVVERTCQSLRVVTDEELARETSARETGSILSGKSDDGKHPRLEDFPSKEAPSSWITQMMGPQNKGKGMAIALGYEKEEMGEFNMTSNQWDKLGAEFHNAPAFLEPVQNHQQDSGSKDGSGSFCFTSGPLPASAKTNTEKRTKNEKTISLQVLRQYFAGSLKDAAKNIGVCPTTLKRICRQHGITRWPSRKIKKVGHSLRKLQLVIDSVQGTEGSIQLSSFYNNFPELSSPNAPEPSHLPTSTVGGELQQGNNLREGTLLSPATTSSGSHSSSSSYCCSTGVKQSSFPVNGSSSGDALSAEQNEGVLKRARSDAELHQLSQEDSKLLVRTYSQKIYSDHVSNEAPPVPKTSSKAQDVGYFRVKAALGDEKIRLTLQPHWGFRELQQEVLRRFNIDNGSRVDLKYLDDDSEWVLLTCDADLEECKDIHTSLKSRTIRLSLNQAPYHPSLGSSFGSTGPF